MTRIVFVLLITVLTGCAGTRHVGIIETGILRTGLSQDAFVKAWGPPDKTSTTLGQDSFSFSARSFRGVRARHGKRPLEVWEYKSREATLVFDQRKLVQWQTGKSVQELRDSAYSQENAPAAPQ